MKYKFLFVLWLVTTGTCAHANAVVDAFYKGDFYLARTLGQSNQSENSLMVACRAGMIIGGYFESHTTAIKSMHQAYDDCRQIEKMNPGHINARITIAIITGFEGKRWQKPGLAKKSRRLLETLVAEFPESAQANAALGGWHSEVSAAGFLPKLYLGAKRSKAIHYFSTAKEMGENDLPFTLEYLKLLARGSKQERKQAQTVIFNIEKGTSLSAIDQMMLEKITGIKHALTIGNKGAIKKAIAKATAFEGIENWRTLPPLDLSGRAGGDTN
jgi:hypothetical protein